MPDWWSWTALGVVGVLFVILAPIVGLVLRRRWLARQGWVIDCSLRWADRPAGGRGGWMLGLAHLDGDRFNWYRVFSLSLKPGLTLQRGVAQVRATRSADEDEAAQLYDQQRIATIQSAEVTVDVAMQSVDMTALLSWIEAAPPGRDYRSLE